MEAGCDFCAEKISIHWVGGGGGRGGEAVRIERFLIGF